jgi:LuxR family maltose regulon positive regulatory protein
LIERLQEGLNYNLVLISAPAGFGKTTLLSEWIRHSKPHISTAWISLDEGDNDPVRFWDYFIAALKTLQPDIGEKILPSLHSSQPPSTEPMLHALINDLSGIAGDFVVVLDDYHLIESQQIHDGITYLLEHIPVQLHVVISSRADPPLPLAFFRGRGTMLEIGADDLRFTLDEVATLFEELTIPGLSSKDVATLNERTEGWAVGLKMAALSMKGQKDISRFIAAFTGSQRYVMDYLMEEVLQKQTQEVRDFLMKTSVLERLSGPLCDAITQHQDSSDILLKLERGHLFIVPLDESRHWYRYEHLFADLLRHQLVVMFGVGIITELHQQASQWYEDNHFRDEAIEHALAAQDWDRAATLIRNAKKKDRGEFVTLINWVRQLPEEVLYNDMELCKQYCAALITDRQSDAADVVVNRMEQMVRSDDTILQGHIAAYRCGIESFRGNYARAWELAEIALSLLPQDYGEPRWVALHFLGCIQYHRGFLKEAETLFTEAYHGIMSKDKDNQEASSPLSLLGLVNIELGKLKKAADYCRQASGMAKLMPHVARAPNFLAFILYEWNDLEAAALYNRQALELARLSRNMEAITWSYYELAHISLVQGDERGAMEYLEKADRTVPDALPYWAHPWQVNFHTLCALLQNNLVDAARWGAAFSEAPTQGQTSYIHISSHLLAYIPIRLLIAQGNKTEAAKQLQVMYDRAVQTGAQYLMIRYRVYQALAADNEESALEFLSEALTMAEPEGYIRTFIDEGELLKPLLEKALSQGITPEYTRKLLAIIEAEERQKRKMKKGDGASSPYQSLLSERELEVLRLMAEGLSNQQIADRLIISLSTVKNHVHNILEKLNVQGRTQAVTQARELEII